MGTSSLEVADVVRVFGDPYRQRAGVLPRHHERALRALTLCRTAALGGHLYVCERCGVIREQFHSCRNRHCPKCQFLDKEKWLEKRRGELLPVEYFHVVFTVPDDLLNPLFLRNPKALYDLLFKAVAQTLLEIAADRKHLGAKIGFLAILHTWGQKLQLHPHIHVIVPGGGISPDGERWIASRNGFLLPVKVLGKLFRGKLINHLEVATENDELLFPDEIDPQRDRRAYDDWKARLWRPNWVVYAKPPFGGAEGGLAYLGRYTHRTAISNHRLHSIEEGRVHFFAKDYRNGGERRLTSLDGVEFLRRLLLHVLPDRFVRIRYYGLLANAQRSKNLERCRVLLRQEPPQEDRTEESPETWQQRLERLTGIDPMSCPVCGKGRLKLLQTLPRRCGNNSAAGARAPP